MSYNEGALTMCASRTTRDRVTYSCVPIHKPPLLAKEEEDKRWDSWEPKAYHTVQP